MKRLTMAALMVFMAVAGFNHASAEMVDVGLGQMEQSEFMALKAMVNGELTANQPAIATPTKHQERYGMLEMSKADFQALRDTVAGHRNSGGATSAETTVAQMVNIGTGEMPLDEFLALKRMVEDKDAFALDRLAARAAVLIHP